MKKVAVIGGGMSGLIAAGFATLNDENEIVIFERQKEIASKILITGNGKCNICNEKVNDISNYSSDDMDKLEDLLRDFESRECISYFEKNGLMLKEKNGYYYPVSNQAKSVVNVIKNVISDKNVQIITDKYINEIKKTERGTYIIEGQEFDYVILAVGGRAGCYKENAFSGRELIKQLELSSTRTMPALTGAICEGDYSMLKGVRCDAKVSLYIDDKFADMEEGELQFAEYGISGIPVFNLSSKLPYGQSKVEFRINLMPNKSKDELISSINELKQIMPDFTVYKALSGFMNTALLSFVLKKTDVSEKTKIKELNAETIERLAAYINESVHHFEKTRDYKNAQIMKGGIDLSEIDENYMSIKNKNLFITGEALDVNGKCGGFNLYFAFHSGKKAGLYIKEDK